MFPRRIRTQLVIFVIVQIGLLMALAGFYLQWQMQRLVEKELGARLITLAKIAAQTVEKTVEAWPVTSLLPGDEESRRMNELRRELQPFIEAGGLSRLVIFNAQDEIYFDSRRELAIGEKYVRLRFDAEEISQALAGKASSAKLFSDAQGNPFKAAYAPAKEQNQIRAVVGVEGSAESLKAIAETRRVLWTIGSLGLLLAAATGILFARQITRPLERLRHAAAAIGAGQTPDLLTIAGSDEVAFLARTMEEMRQAIARREQNLRMMLAGVAHEIRNPLGGIKLFAGLLEKDAPEALRPQVKKILHEVRQLNSIVQDFLEYAKPAESQRQRLELTPLINEVREALGESARNIIWKIEIPAATAVEADYSQTRRILLNLLRNAVEAVNGQGEIRIVAEEQNQKMAISIYDSGPGIPQEVVAKIFEPFFTTKAQGSGLGLALVQRLAEQNGGGVELVASEKGAHFRLLLPAA
ncbi:MAG: HAMP domain-containing histidine kinase [candidate division KSB1 bacterium]|nr:HAMP domain-containing histidine kinase [candidate division KSB1 bacterium]MDZ7367640.1 HAMP domain-containing histidine kinase [candidate division KSB1 bacterium]MDZ7404844.1 HAMP domain-containing histidine kinase [candidate division KSB1 bacterium]